MTLNKIFTISVTECVPTHSKLRPLGTASPPQIDRKPSFPLRFYIALIGCLSSAVMYAARANLSFAIISMVSVPSTRANETLENIVPIENFKTTYDWNNQAQGVILGSYYYGFAGFQIITGYFADRYNVVKLNIIMHLIAVVMTILTPIAADLGLFYIGMVRIVIGIAHAPMLSSLYVLFSKWFPPNEISIPICLMIVGSNLGTAAIMPMTAWLCKQTLLGGWPLAFYATATVNSIIPFLWYFTVTSTPNEHPCISEYEKRYLEVANAHIGDNQLKIDWKSVLTSPVLWAVTFAKAGTGFGYMIVNTKIPAYLESVLGMDLKENGKLNSLLYIVLCASQLSSGPIIKYVLSKKIFSRSAARKVFESIALLIPALALICVANMRNDPTLITILLILSMFSFGGNAGGDMPIVSEIAPDISGTIFGITNTIGAAMGFIAPMIVGSILDNGGYEKGWPLVFYITAGFMAFTAVVFIIFAKAEPQPWGMSRSRENISIIESGLEHELVRPSRKLSHPIFTKQLSNI